MTFEEDNENIKKLKLVSKLEKFNISFEKSKLRSGHYWYQVFFGEKTGIFNKEVCTKLTINRSDKSKIKKYGTRLFNAVNTVINHLKDNVIPSAINYVNLTIKQADNKYNDAQNLVQRGTILMEKASTNYGKIWKGYDHESGIRKRDEYEKNMNEGRENVRSGQIIMDVVKKEKEQACENLKWLKMLCAATSTTYCVMAEDKLKTGMFVDICKLIKTIYETMSLVKLRQAELDEDSSHGDE